MTLAAGHVIDSTPQFQPDREDNVMANYTRLQSGTDSSYKSPQ